MFYGDTMHPKRANSEHQFSPIVDAFIKAMVNGGYYMHATEVIRNAVRRLRQQNEAQRGPLAAALVLVNMPYAQGAARAIRRKVQP